MPLSWYLVHFENQKIVNFGEEDSSEVLENNIKTAIHELKECDGLLCFTDIAGGTPFRVASRLSMEEAEMRVISGTNLPMLLGVLSERDDMDLHELAEYALEVGRRSKKNLYLYLMTTALHMNLRTAEYNN